MSTSLTLRLTLQDISTTTNKSRTFFRDDYYAALGKTFEFSELRCHVPAYELGDRCPTLVLGKR